MMTDFGVILFLFIFASNFFFNILLAENCQLQNLDSFVYKVPINVNASNFWIYSLQNDCTLQIWSNNDIANEQSNYSNGYINDKIPRRHSTKCKNGQISTSSSKDTVSIQVFVQNNETSKIFATTLTPDQLETTKVTKLHHTFTFDSKNQSMMQPLSCYSMPKSDDSSFKPFIVCIFYNFNEYRLFSGIFDSDGRNFSNLNSINGLKNQSETLQEFFSASNVSVSFYRDDFNQRLTAYLNNENGDFLVLENRALSSTFTFTIKKSTKMQKNYQNVIHISSFEPFPIFFDAFTSQFCSSNNICRRYLFPFLNEPSPTCFDESKEEEKNQSSFKNVGIIFNNFRLKSDIQNPYADNNLIFKTHGFLILMGILLISTIFLTILLTFCVLGIYKCLKAASDSEDEIEISQSFHEDIVVLEPPPQLNNKVVERESENDVAARTIIVVESFTCQFEEEDEEEEKEPSFKPENFSYYIKE